MTNEDTWQVGESRFVYGVAPEEFTHDALAYCVGDVDEFLSRWWRSGPAVLRRRDDAFEELVGIDEVEQLISSRGLRSDQIRVSSSGRRVDETAFSRWGTLAGSPVRGVVRPSALYSLLGKGATLVLDDVDKYSPTVAAHCRGISRSLGHPAQASLYLTAPGRAGLNPHTDRDHVLVMQLAGAKRWRVGQEGTDSFIDTVLRPGDCLYVPADVEHAAAAEPGAVSVHLTVGVTIPGAPELLAQVAQVWGVGLRPSPVAPTAASDSASAVASAVDPSAAASAVASDSASDVRTAVALLSRHVDTLTDDELRESLGVYGSLGAHAAPLSVRQLSGLGSVDGATRLRLARDAVVALKRVSPQACEVRFGVKELQLPVRVCSAFRQLATAEFDCCSVVGAGSPDAAADLARLLVAEGVAEVVRTDDEERRR